MEQRITVIGLGLMGGSLARALRPHLAYLAGVDRDKETLEKALAAGVIDAGTCHLPHNLTPHDFLIFATPVRTILQLLAELPTHCPDGCWVMDLGSTKQTICAAMEQLPASFAAIGGHPICGKEKAGFSASDADLFWQKSFVLTPTSRTTTALWQMAKQIVQWIGGKLVEMPAQLHDQLLAATSHLPYLVSATLMQTVAELAQTEPQTWQMSGSGLRDTTRLAGSDPTMILDILLTNHQAILPHLAAYQQILGQLVTLLTQNDSQALAEWLLQAQKGRLSYEQTLFSPPKQIGRGDS